MKAEPKKCSSKKSKNNNSGESKSTCQFMDKRPEAEKFRKIKESAKSKINMNGNAVIQNAVTVSASGEGTKDVVIKAAGDAEEFQNGIKADDWGWNNVTSYAGRVYINRSRYRIKKIKGGTKKRREWYTQKETVRAGPYHNNYLVAQAGHVLAKQNGGDGSDDENVFAQDGGVNNGPWKTYFETPMRNYLDMCYDGDKVDFRVGLHSEDDNITRGALVKESDELDASDEDVFHTTDESDSESSG
ncbi:DNA/RNA non-specific endonuclease [Alteromonadaceae bacterium 2753L.S.0a.02]|nr:DNA/RNA non-specific endonuclease [Alteromonadaceae bacterium 2753L.S.0a.02]